jgi:hypothetical protein
MELNRDTGMVTMNEDEYLSATEDGSGLCLKCGVETSGVEPDAREYRCEACGERGVYGIEELMVMGLIELE